MTEKVARTTDGEEVALDNEREMQPVALPPEVSLNSAGVARDNSKEVDKRDDRDEDER